MDKIIRGAKVICFVAVGAAMPSLLVHRFAGPSDETAAKIRRISPRPGTNEKLQRDIDRMVMANIKSSRPVWDVRGLDRIDEE